MDERGRCLCVFLIFVLLKLVASVAQDQEQVRMDQEQLDDKQADAGYRSYLPKFLQAKYGKTLQKPIGSEVDSSGEVKGGDMEVKNRMFSGDTDASFRKTKSYGGSRGKYSSMESSEVTGFNGGCGNRPSSPMNAALRCSSYSGCRATCLPGYKFPNAENQLFITCQEGEWRVEGVDASDALPHCQPTCLPACQHNGICTGPNQCNCPENFSGPQCQFQKRPCLNYPTLPANSRRSCSSKACTISCAQGFQFPGGSAIANMMCKDGRWTPSRPDWVTLPDCEAVCEPKCSNGGNCLSYNMCQCPQEFTGPQCQYSMDACSSKKLHFNGGFQCSGDADSFTCTLSCPLGIEFESTPAAKYICLYSTGVFEPSPIPQCMFGDAMVIPGELQESIKYMAGSEQTVVDFETHEGGSYLLSRPGHMQHSATGGVSYRPNHHGYTTLTNGTAMRPSVTVIESRPVPGVCYTWGGGHYKTFDGNIISFDSDCSFTLARDAVDNTFSVNLLHKDGRRSIKMFLQDKEYVLKLNDAGVPVLVTGKIHLSIPSQLSGITTEYMAHFVLVKLTGVGVSVKWDAKDFVSVDVSASLWNRTEGLCGKLDGRASNDLETKGGAVTAGVNTFISSWQVHNIDESCNTSPLDESACASDSPVAATAAVFCNKLLVDPRLATCREHVDPARYHAACTWDYCACKRGDRSACACHTLAVYVRECETRVGSQLAVHWRDAQTCPVTCTGGRIYLPCGPAEQGTCGSVVESSVEACEEGCYCPDNTVLHDGACITRSECPCQYRGKSFAAGAQIPKDCNTCTCSFGQWVCTQVLCGSRCSSVGDPHYVTFDGKRYDFMGTCSYYLMKADNYSIEAENVACAGTISQTLGFALSSSDMPSCTKTVTVRVGSKAIKLKQNGQVMVDGQEVSKLPFKVAGAYVHVVSSIFLMVDLDNGLRVWWDGVTRVYIDAPATFQGHTKGLCGKFNLNQKDDFWTPEGDVEQSVEAFANKWKTSEKCDNVATKPSSHPCDVNVHNKAVAEKHCSKIKSALFKDCHWLVDYEAYYQDCLFDMCSCQGKIGNCLCPILAAYGKECTRMGVRVDWRNQVRECGVHCSGGQQYQVCGDTCTRSCHDIAREPDCRTQCVEGCNCPEGETMGVGGECIPIGQCMCTHSGVEYQPGYTEVRAGSKGLQLCTCSKALWECRPASDQEALEYPKTQNLKSVCLSEEHSVFTQCEPVEPTTCQNMHKRVEVTPAVCQAGCVCSKGYVMDAYTRKCILPVDCPCHHGGRGYTEAQTMQEDCNTCTCLSGKWQCTDRACAGVCTAWGDSHFKTFDGRHYDFHGTCDYVLVKGVLTKADSFDVTIQNVLCGTSGVSCSKSVTLKVGGADDKHESVTFTRDKPVPSFTGLDRITIREAGLFVYAEVFDLGLVLQWDRGTRVYVKADPKWKNKLKGLCGNYNNNEMDDFETPSGGVSEVSASLFGDSWRLQTYCPEAVEVSDTCELLPHRKVWAVQQCGVLKSEVFQACHSEVPLEAYMERCVLDTCACDMGGDCACLCTAIAAYAHECNMRGVPVKWRTQRLCPIQCDAECAHYSPCVATCPRQTCDNQYVHAAITQLCGEDACVEGCAVDPCPAGQVYNNMTTLECVPLATCKTVCLQIGDVTYYEGDKMAGDECHTCFCSRHKQQCTGQPCPPTVPISTPQPAAQPLLACVDGWSEWFNRHQGKGYGDVEPVPNKIDMQGLGGSGVCDMTDMSGIRCRTVNTHNSATDVGQDVTCSLDGGLTCKGKCHDFEISVLCDCGTATTTVAPPTCDRSRPSRAHPTDCHVFYECVATASAAAGGIHWVEKTCGRDMMYNPHTYVCDWPATVAAVRPHCADMLTTQRPHQQGCTEGWSGWFNSTVTPDGDYELLDNFEAAGALPCSRDQLVDIDCKFHKTVKVPRTKSAKGGRRTTTELVSYRESGDLVTCSLDTGLECVAKQQQGYTCEDYAVRVLCQCQPASTPAPPCPVGQVWSECAVPCAQVCHYYGFRLRREGTCTEPQICLPGCVDPSVASCPPGSLWRDQATCVKQQDCTCKNSKGNPVKPGAIVRDDCEVCQCVNNEYNCFARPCVTEEPNPISVGTERTLPPPSPGARVAETTTEPPTTEPSTVTLPGTEPATVTPPTIIPSTVTPPQPCLENGFDYLVKVLDPHSLSGSSSLSPLYAPYNAKLNTRVTPLSGGSWVPQYSNTDQYLQVDLGRVEPIYGVVTQGSPVADDYVTSYQLLYGEHTNSFSYVMDDAGQPAVFRGPIDGNTPVKQMFAAPIEARYVRFNPRTYHGAMAMRVDVIGCGAEATPTTTQQPNEPEYCEDDMGLDNGMMADQQVSVSSVLDDDVDQYGASRVRPHSSGWVPKLDDNQWIMFDFLEPRNLTGVTTQGQPEGDRWVEAFKVKYSHDRKAWNPIVDMDFNELVFLGNYDSSTPAENRFPGGMIQARYLKLVPIKWHNGVGLRCHIDGCYLPYPEPPTSPPPEPTVFVPRDCKLCPGQSQDLQQLFEGDTCSCGQDRLWDGEKCVSPPECPCFVGHIPYAVGTVYESEDCQQCTCKLGGVSACKDKLCDKCEAGLQSVQTTSCGCICKPCPTGTVYCPTSNICIDESNWCDGIQHCPDDEVNCPTEPPTTTTPRHIVTPKQCPTIACPPNYRVIVRKFSPLELVEEQSSSYEKTSVKGKKGTKGGQQRPKPQKLIAFDEDECPQFECEPIQPSKGKNESGSVDVSPVRPPCATPQCPVNYKLTLTVSKHVTKACPRYTCIPLVVDSSCNVTARTFRTFDGSEFKYDLCNHIIARDQDNKHDWEITMSKNCSELFACNKYLTIRQDDHVIRLDTRLQVHYLGNTYTCEQANKIAAVEQMTEIARTGDLVYVRSHRYLFWLTWDQQGDLKLWVNGKLSGHVEGLCGFFNERAHDDKRKPDHQLARSTLEFGDSWAHPDLPEHCMPLRCPIHVQNTALDMCYKVREKPLSRCNAHVPVDRFISHCVESACTCLAGDNTTRPGDNTCQCQALLGYVTECQASNPQVDLASWRVQHDCPVRCVDDTSKDCYRRACELSCDNLMIEDACPHMDNVCFPGCYCPDGLVRKGDTCVKPVDCRDCVCDGFGDPTYMNFDRSNFTFNGNCTYVAARDMRPTGGHDFQVLVTNGACHDKPGLTCTQALSVLHKDHIVVVQREHEDKQLVTLLDNERITEFPHVNSWLLVETIPGSQVTVLIPQIQLEVTFFYHNYAFVIRLPSHLYKSRTEGLCGNCNRDPSDDLKTSNDVLTDDIDEFAISWLQPSPSEDPNSCKSEAIVECLPLPPDQDPCLKIMEVHRFGKCHAVIDPVPYLVACQQDNCRNKMAAVPCHDLEAYARECLREGICVDWRSPDVCPYQCDDLGKEYSACGSGCQVTCENHLQLQQDPASCEVSPVTDSCACPQGQVYHNSSCLPARLCLPCDDQGHYDADQWQADACTSCSCVGRDKTCERTACASTVCEVGADAVLLSGTEHLCCPQYMCVPAPTVGPTCATPQQPVCAADQLIKMETLANGCQQFVCQCKECDAIDLNEVETSFTTEPPLPEGWQRVLNTSGCCPHNELVCNTHVCTPPPPCNTFYQLTQLPLVQGACCHKYVCEPPKDMCLYEFQYEVDPLIGGERLREPADKFTDLHKAGSTWHDGACRSCSCGSSPSGHHIATCSVEACPEIGSHADAAEYQLTAAPPLAGTCCPVIMRTACLVQGEVLQVGNEVRGEEACETLSCVETKHGVQIQKNTEKCNTNCQKGEKYEPAAEGSGQCCGHCQQVACVVDDQVHEVDTRWHSYDHCVTFTCVNANNSVHVESVRTDCPAASAKLLSEYVIQLVPVPGECCQRPVSVACLIQGKRYGVDETWTEQCVTVACVAGEGGVVKQETLHTCDEHCDEGWQYVPQPGQCCGKCHQTACVVDGVIRKPGEMWYAEDNCTSFTCTERNKQFQVTMMQTTCPNLTDCPTEDVYQDGCCQQCKLTTRPKLLCAPEAVNELETVDLVLEMKQSHGKCTNLRPIKAFKKCHGTCDSSTYYNKYTLTHDSKCQCCQASSLHQISVEMTCEDGYSYEKQVAVPSACSCEQCSEQQTKQNVMKIPAAKGGAKGRKTAPGYGGDMYSAMRGN